MASTLGKVTQERNDKKNSQGGSNKAYLKTDAEFKKLFGLTKDLRICLTRIPDHLHAGEGFDSFRSLVKSDRETKFIVKEEERKQVIDFQVFFVGTPERDECVNFLDLFSESYVLIIVTNFAYLISMYYTRMVLKRTIYTQVKMHPWLINGKCIYSPTVYFFIIKL